MSQANATFQNASVMLGGALFQKLLIFLLNQAVISHFSPEVFGKISIQLELYLSMCLFLSRESIRIACLRYLVQDEQHVQAIINISYLPMLAVIGIASIFYSISNYTAQIDHNDDMLYLLYTIAACIECLGEPCYNLYMNALLVQPRVYAESIALACKSIFTFLMIILFKCDIITFGYAQIIYSILYVSLLRYSISMYIVHMKDNIASKAIALYPAPLSSHITSYLSYLDASIVYNSVYMLRTIIVKQILTEADKITLTMLSTSHEQGLYALTSNYGALVARIVFLPLEESARLTFTTFASHLRQAGHSAITSDETILSPQQLSSTLKEDASYIGLYDQLHVLLRIVCYIGSIVLLFGPPYLHIVMALLVRGKQWDVTSVSSILSVYCIYLFLLAINGMTEAFVTSVIPTHRLGIQSLGLLYSSLTFLPLAAILVPSYGSIGVLLSNLGGMGVRIAYNVWLIEAWHANPILLLDKADASKIPSAEGSSSYISRLLPAKGYAGLVLCCLLMVHGSWYAYSAGYYAACWLPAALVHFVIGIVTGGAYLLISFWQLARDEQDAMLGVLKRRSRLLEKLINRLQSIGKKDQ